MCVKDEEKKPRGSLLPTDSKKRALRVGQRLVRFLLKPFPVANRRQESDGDKTECNMLPRSGFTGDATEIMESSVDPGNAFIAAAMWNPSKRQ